MAPASMMGQGGNDTKIQFCLPTLYFTLGQELNFCPKIQFVYA